MIILLVFYCFLVGPWSLFPPIPPFFPIKRHVLVMSFPILNNAIVNGISVVGEFSGGCCEKKLIFV